MNQQIPNWMKKMDATAERRIAIRNRLKLACEVIRAAEEAAVELQLDRLAEQTIYSMRQIIGTKVEEIRREKCQSRPIESG